MNEPRKGVPEGASAVIPRLFCRNPGDEVEFCVATFQAEERVRRPGPDGTLAHALITIGPAMVMIEPNGQRRPIVHRLPTVELQLRCTCTSKTSTKRSSGLSLAARSCSCRRRINLGAIESPGSWTQLDTCGRLRRASKKQRNNRGTSA